MPESNTDLAQQLQAIIDTAIDGIITINSKGIVETLNPSAANLFGYTPDEVIGHNIAILMPEPYHSEHDGYIHRYQTTRKPHIIGIGREVSGKKKNGDIFPFRLAVSEVLLNDRVIYTGIIHDLTEVKNAENEIKVLNRRLEKKVNERTIELEKTVNTLLSTNTSLQKEIKDRELAEKKLQLSESELRSALEKEKELSELKSRFVSMASHEFRTPLTSILSSASLIGRYTMEDQQANRDKHIGRIKAAVANLTGILNDFLSLSKLEEGKVEVHLSELNLDLLCKEVIEDTKGLLKSEQNITHTIVGENPNVIVDERILRNILFNLISNAIKYSEKDIACSITFEEEYFQFEIKDQGIGIPKEDQKYLFTRFFRAGNVTNIQGTGLGLNIVKRYVDILGGEISFHSEHEVGSTFFVKIPYVNWKNRSMKKIVVVEDNLEVRENLAEILSLSGYEVHEAENGKIGVKVIMETKPDLILCDVMMPELDGFGVLKVLNHNPELMHIPFMFLTAKAEKTDFRKGMGLGADDYITKPYDDVELLEDHRHAT